MTRHTSCRLDHIPWEPAINPSSTFLFKVAGVAAALSGTLFIVVQYGHPAPGTFTTETSEWVARGATKAAMTALALVGITGIYLHQRRHAGLLGVIGYATFAIGYLAMFAVEVIATTVLPLLTDSQPELVNAAVAAASGESPSVDIGHLQTLFNITGIGYLLGGLLFGIALYRTRVLNRWAGALLAAGTVSTAALAVLPEAFNRPIAIPTGIALMALGTSLWRNADTT